MKLESKSIAISAVAGSVILFIGTYLHPSGADPNVPLAAFAEYAADQTWVASHLLQLVGVTLLLGTLVLLGQYLSTGPAAAVAALSTAGAIASLALAGALQAVDGVALKAVVDAWAAAARTDNSPAFYAALAVRQIEIGLASMDSLVFGVTVSLFGVALLVDKRLPTLLGVIAIAGGIALATSGVIFAYTGFSPLGMTVNLSASMLLLIWMIGLGFTVWRTGKTPVSNLSQAARSSAD